jgi:uncharacterized YigZ family protein
MKQFLTISKTLTTAQEIISKSRFIGYAMRTDTVEEAQDFIKRISSTHYDATHNCYAYIIDNAMKFSDDGEPSGTAGMPMLDTLRKQGVDHVCVVVTRYFGGIKLGAGGLVRAYSGTAAKVLDAAPKVKVIPITEISIKADYTLYNQLKTYIEKEVKIKAINYSEAVEVIVQIESEKANPFISSLTDRSNARAGISVVSEYMGEL